MRNNASIITSNWQITIPEDVRKEIPFKVGQRIAWEVEGDKLVGRRVRTMSELAGSLKSVASPKNKDSSHELAQAALVRHHRIAKQKP